MFDKMDGNHDGSVTSDEVKAMPAVQKHGGTGQNFVAHFDGDKDGKVTTAEYDTKRTSFFDKMDKNKDGFIDQSEFKAQPPNEDAGV
jgi:Ca2+-binding EF-hand superfamily protein